MTVVRVLRPVYRGTGMPWIVHDQFHARECQIKDSDIPEPIKTQMPAAHFAYFSDALWNYGKQTWDLTIAILTHNRSWR